ncbi:hypothetical protein V6C42_12805 [Pseudoclostridium thermosuccinogenes]
MSKGLRFALYLVQKNLDKPTDKLIEILKPYKKELERLAGVKE